MAKSEAQRARRARYLKRKKTRAVKLTPADLHTRLLTMDLEEGFRYLEEEPQQRQIGGFWVESKYKSVKLQMFRQRKIQCVECGIVATHWHFERHKNDTVMPFYINLYAAVGADEVMLTWDHKIPRSLGGSNDLANAQCMCATCNSRKGNLLSISEMIEYQEDQQYVLMLRDVPKLSGFKRTLDMVRQENDNLQGVNNVF